MKNIAIFGSSRAGKSTLSKMISKKYPNYHIIIGDDLRSTFTEVFPDLNINSENGSGMKDDFPEFLSHLFHKNIKRNQGQFNYIVETCDITPEKAVSKFQREDTIILFLGITQLNVKQHFQEIRKYETKKDWTYGRTDESLLEHCQFWIQKSKEYEEKCRQFNIWYVDTSFDREEVLNHTFAEIEKQLNEDEA